MVLDRYLIAQFIPNLIFSIAICTIVSELVGISFEQVKFVATEGLPIDVAVWVHYFKLPAFVVLSLPLSTLMAAILTYSKLSITNEIVALQSHGISEFRLISPAIAIALILFLFTFGINELVVPVANYKAAMILEQEWQVDRTQLAKYNKREIVYHKFTENKTKPKLEFIFFADRFDGENMQNITLLKYNNKHLQQIITAQKAVWNQNKQLWQLVWGQQNLIDANGNYLQTKDFARLSVELTKDILDYADHHRDYREMNILELYKRLHLINHTNNIKAIRQLQINIQERYAIPFSCVIFAFLGAILGISSKIKPKTSSLTIAMVAIFGYYSTQFIATALTATGVLPVILGVWLPNLLCLIIGWYGKLKLI